MKKHILTLMFVLIAAVGFGQTPFDYQLNYNNIKFGKSPTGILQFNGLGNFVNGITVPLRAGSDSTDNAASTKWVKQRFNSLSGLYAKISGGNVLYGNQKIISNNFPTPQSAIFIGDSQTDGNPGPSPQSNRFSTLTALMTGVTEVNHGIGSSTMQKGTPINPIGGVNMQDRLSDIPTKTSSIKYLVFEFGDNDFGWNGGNYDTVGFKSAYRNTINNALSKGWSAKDIYVISPTYINSTGFALYGSLNGGNVPTLARLNQYVSASQDVSAEFGVNFINAYTLMSSNGSDGLLYSDGLHLNNSGHLVLANALANKINSNISPLSVVSSSSNLFTVNERNGSASVLIGTTNETGQQAPTNISLGAEYSSTVNNVFGSKIKITDNGAGTWGLGVSAGSGLEYFSGNNKHTFYGDIYHNGTFNTTGNVFGLQFISQGGSAAYNFVDRSNSSKNYALFGDGGIIKVRSSDLGPVDLFTVNGANADFSINGNFYSTGNIKANQLAGTGTRTVSVLSDGTLTIGGVYVSKDVNGAISNTATGSFNAFNANSTSGVGVLSTSTSGISVSANASTGKAIRAETSSGTGVAVDVYQLGTGDLLNGGNLGGQVFRVANNGGVTAAANNGAANDLVRNVDAGFKQVKTASGNGSATTISIAHGMTGITSASWCSAIANNSASAGIQYVTVDASNINIFYTVAPVSGTNNLLYSIEIKP